MTVPVYWGSPRQTQLVYSETLPAKLDVILDKLQIRERVKGRRVAIKMHLGYGIGYSMVHPVFVRRVVQAVKDGGGQPFVTDVPYSVETAYERGYTAETLGCPLYPSTGVDEKWFYSQPYEFMSLREFQLGGAIKEASFLIDLAHVKGHPCTGYGAAIKNIGLGCMTGTTRGQMHDVVHYVPYVHKDKLRDEAHRVAIREACPYGAIADDRDDPEGLHLHHDNCNCCMRCQSVADGAFDIKLETFMSFIKAMNIAAKLVMDTFEPGNAAFISLATQMTPLCDCFGFTSAAVLPDAGIFGANDPVAIDQAMIDLTAKMSILEENMPGMMEMVSREGHPWQQIHGAFKDPYAQLAHAEAIGLGTRAYELVDVMPFKEPDFKQSMYVQAAPR